MKTLLLACVGAFCAAFGFAFSATAAETIAYWPFGTNGFHDVSGNGHDLTGVEVAESDAAYMSLNQGRTDQYLKTAAALDLSGETAVTFECWWRKMAAYNSQEYPMLMATAHTGANDLGGFIVCQYNNADGVIRSQYRSAASSWQLDYTNEEDPLFVGGKVNDGMWHHVAYVVNRAETTKAKQCRLYVDGVEVAKTGTWTSEPDVVAALFNDYFVIGGGTDYSSSVFWNGYIDDVRISRGVLTPDEFLKYPTVGKTMRADDGKLPVVAYWPFGGKRGKDATGNGFDLTMSANVVLESDGCAKTSWTTRQAQFACAPSQTFPFSAFSKTGLTIEMYMKAQSSSTNLGMVVESNVAYWSGQGAFRFSYDATPAGYRTVFTGFHVSGSVGAYSQTTEATFGNLGDNVWRHYAIVYDPTKTGAGIVTLYVDGVPANNKADNANQSAFALGDYPLYLFRRANSQIGSEYTASPYYGCLDDVRITAGALTPEQFLPIRSVGSTIALYRFDQNSLADVSGCGNELVHCQAENVGSGTPTFGVGDSASSGTGIVLSGKNSGKEWLRSASPVDLTGATAMTVEVDYDCPNPLGTDSSGAYVLAASDNATTAKGGFVVCRVQNSINAQFRKSSSEWSLLLNGNALQSMDTVCPNGYRRVRYGINVGTPGTVAGTVVVDGAAKQGTSSDTLTSLGNMTFCFGYSPSYFGPIDCSDPSKICYMKGKILRVAISDVKLDSTDFVLDNLPPDPETKATLAYWDFDGFSDKSGAGNDLVASSGCGKRDGALLLDGTSSAATEDALYLADLTQATIECFVLFGETPSSGTLFSMGSGVGSFSVTADATAGTLTGSFIPYDHLTASCGGAAALAPLAGKTAWHHVALVIDRTKSGADAVRFYVDYERATPAGRAWDAAATMLDGTLTVGTGFTGRIDDLRVSKGALEPSEFIQERTKGGMCIAIR